MALEEEEFRKVLLVSDSRDWVSSHPCEEAVNPIQKKLSFPMAAVPSPSSTSVDESRPSKDLVVMFHYCPTTDKSVGDYGCITDYKHGKMNVCIELLAKKLGCLDTKTNKVDPNVVIMDLYPRKLPKLDADGVQDPDPTRHLPPGVASLHRKRGWLWWSLIQAPFGLLIGEHVQKEYLQEFGYRETTKAQARCPSSFVVVAEKEGNDHRGPTRRSASRVHGSVTGCL